MHPIDKSTRALYATLAAGARQLDWHCQYGRAGSEFTHRSPCGGIIAITAGEHPAGYGALRDDDGYAARDAAYWEEIEAVIASMAARFTAEPTAVPGLKLRQLSHLDRPAALVDSPPPYYIRYEGERIKIVILSRECVDQRAERRAIDKAELDAWERTH